MDFVFSVKIIFFIFKLEFFLPIDCQELQKPAIFEKMDILDLIVNQTKQVVIILVVYWLRKGL